MNIIDISNLTKDYGEGKGIFDISISIKKGEVYGYLGPNGAGKSTTLRHLMGFGKADSGSASIMGMDCWKEQKKIQPHLGYLPGEISFPDDMTGEKYLKLISKMRGMRDFTYAQRLLDMFDINPRAGIKRMSKGMKQKIGITAAFMHDPEIILLDEPTSGLDPLMQNKFISLLEEEKSKGKTIIISSHIFEEVEKTCDRIGMIKNGRIIQEISVEELTRSKMKTYTAELSDELSARRLCEKYPGAVCDKNRITLSINDSELNEFIRHLAQYDILSLNEEKHTLEEYFMKFYGGDSKNV